MEQQDSKIPIRTARETLLQRRCMSCEVFLVETKCVSAGLTLASGKAEYAEQAKREQGKCRRLGNTDLHADRAGC